MKKIFVLFLGISLMQACNNSSETTTEATPNPANTENVNGNVPDSTSSTNLNQELPKDSSRVKDSTQH
jgi:hypothetical protein